MKNISNTFAALCMVILMVGSTIQIEGQTIKLMPNQGKMQCNIVMNIDGERNIFALTVPETIGNREEMLLNFPETNLIWEGPEEDGVVSTGWTKDSVISYTLDLIPGKDYIDAEMIITNLSEDEWEDVWSFNCLNPVKATTFQNLEMDRTYMSTPEGPKRLSDTRRTIGHRPGIGVYFSEKMELDEEWPFISWFDATSEEKTDGDYLVTLSESGKAYMAATSPNTLYLFNNLEFTCIHAAPTFGNIGPGETSTLTTRFYLSEGGLEDFLKRFDKDNKQTSAGQGRSMEDFIYIENEQLKLGIDTSMGGAITYLALKSDNVNLINNYDLGRQVQISFYAYPVPYAPSPDKQPHQRWLHIGWNPIQAGDVAGNGSRILELRQEKESLFVSCIPMHWPLDDVPGECVYESRISLKGNQVLVNAKIINKRPDQTLYRARNNEFPALYTNGTHYKLYSYTGAEPFTRDELTLIPKRNVKSGEFPWSRFFSTESWAALINESGSGLGIYSPVTDMFLGGFVGDEGRGGTLDNPTGYISPVGNEILDHNIEFEYGYVLIAGELDQIREQVYAIADKNWKPDYNFSSDRQHWYYEGFRDTGWPPSGGLHLTPETSNASLLGPIRSFRAKENMFLIVKAASRTGSEQMTFLWKRLGDDKFDENERGAEIMLINDGEEHTYRLNLEGVPNWNKLITTIKFEFDHLNTSGDWIRVSNIYFE